MAMEELILVTECVTIQKLQIQLSMEMHTQDRVHPC
jgi:hypothetical protein